MDPTIKIKFCATHYKLLGYMLSTNLKWFNKMIDTMKNPRKPGQSELQTLLNKELLKAINILMPLTNDTMAKEESDILHLTQNEIEYIALTTTIYKISSNWSTLCLKNLFSIHEYQVDLMDTCLDILDILDKINKL